LKKSESKGKPVEETKAAEEGKFRQAVLRIVRQGTLAHCYLACGHMLTMQEAELSAALTSMECWAREAERNGS
jgi:hypothetical protein